MLDVVDDCGVTGDEASHRRQGLGERAHHEIDLVLEPEVLGGSAPILTEDAESVGIVDEKPRFVAILELDDLG